jgi:general secretion pathway protein D
VFRFSLIAGAVVGLALAAFAQSVRPVAQESSAPSTTARTIRAPQASDQPPPTNPRPSPGGVVQLTAAQNAQPVSQTNMAAAEVAAARTSQPPAAPIEVAAARNTPAPAPAAPPPGAPNLVRLQFPNSDVSDVLHLYEQLTGKKLVMDNFVQGKVNIFISKDVPREEAIKIIEMNLLMNGFSLIPAENDIVKVIGTGKNPRTTGVPIISDDSQIPDGDHVISYLFKLRYADPQELQQVLGQYLSPPQSFTSFLALPKSGSLLVTENSSVIRSLVKIIDQVDIPPAEVVSEFVKLERADASKVCDMLKEIFEKTPGQPGGVPVPGGVRPVRAPVAAPVANVEPPDIGSLAALSEESVVVGKIKLSPDVRTNRIHVITRPINMPFIRKLIAEFDANVEFAKPVTRDLKYISAGEVLPVLVTALTEPGTEHGGGDLGAGGAPGAQQQQNRQNRTGGAGNTPYAGGLSSSGGGSGESNLNISEELSTTAVDTTPKAVTIGNAKIIADQRANAIIVLGNREVVVKVQKLLDEMDVKAPQVALSTVIGELTLHDDEEFGVDYFVKYKNKVVATSRNTGVALPIGDASPSGSVPPVNQLLDPANLIDFSKIIRNVGSGTNVYVAAGNYLAAIVHLLHSTGNFKVVSRPMVFTSNNKKAIIASGQEIPVPVSTVTAPVGNGGFINNGLGQQSNIQFKKVALQLEVVPLINSDKEVSLDILQKLDSLAGSTLVDGNLIPNIATRYIRTNVSAPNGSTIVLGGLITDQKKKDYNGIPILDRLPWVGALFRNTSKVRDRTELIVLMRPEVSLTNLDLYRLRVKNEKRTHFGADLDEDENMPEEEGGKQLPGPIQEMPPPDIPLERGK